MDILGIHFANPFWLWVLAALPALLFLAFVASRGRHATLSLGNPRVVENASGLLSPLFLPWFLKAGVLALCLLAAARPQTGREKVEVKKPVTDLFVAFDVSTSMLAEDLKPNRMAAAKRILAGFLDRVEDVRMGLTVFAAISFTQCPLTSDLNVMKRLLDRVDVFSVKVDGTAIGDALLSSLNRLQKGAPGTEEGKQEGVHQAIILMTDGSNNAGQVHPLAAAKVAASRGIKIYAIGMGSLLGVPLPYVYEDGRVTYAVDHRGNVVKTRLDMELLKEVARLTGGKAYNAADNKSLEAVLSDIAKLEKREVFTTTKWEYKELAPASLLAAFLLLAFDLLLGMTVLRVLP